MPRNIRLALLLCDEIILNLPVFRTIYGDYAKIFHNFLTASLNEISSDVTFILDAYDVVEDMAYPPDDVHYDGILISGSRATAYEPLPWIVKLIDYVKHVIDKKPSLKIFGICFGHQIITMALGGEVKRGPWELSVTKIHLTRLGKTIFGGPQLHLQEIHVDQVSTIPHSAHLLGWSHVTESQGMVVFHSQSTPSAEELELDKPHVHLESIRVLTLQGHPEFTESIMRELLAEEAEVVSQEVLDDALKRVGLPTDAIGRVGRVVWGILGVRSRHEDL